MSTTDNWVEEIGKPAFESIREMVAASQVDWQRLEDLADCDDLSPEEKEELASLRVEAGGCKDEEQARERIQEDPLSVQVRSDWHDIGDESEPSEFMILLATGGPAVRIVGELDGGEPSRPRLEVQDWGKSWTEYVLDSGGYDSLQAYCECFFFGE